MKYYILLIISFFMVSCSNENKCKTMHKTDQVIKGNLHLIRVYNGCNESPEIEYEALKMPDSSLVHNGYYKEFYANGKLRKLGFFKYDIQDSIAIQYRKDGIVDFDNYKFEGQRKGFQNCYDSSGKYLERSYYINDSTYTFRIIYSSVGKIEKMEGRLFNVFWDKEPSLIKLGDSIFIGNEIITLDHMVSDCKVFITRPSNKDTIFPKLITLKMNNATYKPVLFKPTQKGNFQYHIKVSLISKRAIIKTDTMSFPLIVR